MTYYFGRNERQASVHKPAHQAQMMGFLVKAYANSVVHFDHAFPQLEDWPFM